MNRLDQLRVDRMMHLGCVYCAHLGLVCIAQECHHIVEGNRRLGDWFTLPLCRGHHQGDWSRDQLEIIPADKRVGIHSGSKACEAVYPAQRELWERVQACLHLSWPQSKIVPRRVA